MENSEDELDEIEMHFMPHSWYKYTEEYLNNSSVVYAYFCIHCAKVGEEGKKDTSSCKGHYNELAAKFLG